MLQPLVDSGICARGLAFGAALLLAACASPAIPDDSGVTEDFEAYTTGQAPNGHWTVETKGGAVTVDDTRAVSGTKAARFDVEGKGGAFISTGGARAGRMQVFLEAAPEGDVHWTLIEARGHRASDGHIAEVRIGGQHPVAGGSRLMANYETPDSYTDPSAPGSDCWHHAAETDVMPTGRWVEIAWAFGDDATVAMSIDGKPVPAMTVNGTGQGCLYQKADYAWELPRIETINLGWESYQADGPRRLWIDDIKLWN